MDLLPDADQAQIAAEVRDLLEHQSPPGRLRELAERTPVADPKLWRQATDQGWFALALAEDDGGAGLGLAEQTLLFRELGRYLVPGPFLGTVLAAHVAAASGEKELIAAIVDGRVPVALCEPSTGEPSTGDQVRTFDADDAEMFVVVDATAATLLPRPAVHEQRRRPSLDLASRWAELTINGDAICRADGDATWIRGQVLVAAMLSGIAEATRDASASYAKLRKQFDVAIGSFQAVKHRCAEQAVRAEAATQATTLAALSVDTGRDDAALQVASARLVAGDYAVANAADNVQNHGGIGYTAEHDAHLFVKRAHVLALTLGEPGELQAAVLDAPPIRPSE
jgi:alkylation response protein AidB-like acyl-CoA dehydrogenase